MKLACAVGLFGLACVLAQHDAIVEARKLTVAETPIPIVIVIDLPDDDDGEEESLSLRNRNPLNVKGKGWQGQVGSDVQGHAVFSSMEYGVRAASLVLRSYAAKHGIDTVEGIVNRFAEGNREHYIKFLCKRLGVRRDESFSLITRMPELLRSMARFECGRKLPDTLFAPYDILAKI